MKNVPVLVGFEWTDRRFRAWGFTADGEIAGAAEAVETAPPAPHDMLARTHYHIREWLGAGPDVPVIGCGDTAVLVSEATRRELTMPRALSDLPAALVRLETAWIVPWITQADPPDLTRGSETMLIGIGEAHGAVCLAGRVTRHCRLDHGRLVRLSTEIPAEIRDLLMLQPGYAPPPGQAFDLDTFRVWVERAIDRTAAPSPFAVRAASDLGFLKPEHRAAALAGLLIGSDVAKHYEPGDEVLLVADDPLLEAYGIALDVLGADVEEASADEALPDGLFEIADLAGLLDDV